MLCPLSLPRGNKSRAVCPLLCLISNNNNNNKKGLVIVPFLWDKLNVLYSANCPVFGKKMSSRPCPRWAQKQHKWDFFLFFSFFLLFHFLFLLFVQLFNIFFIVTSERFTFVLTDECLRNCFCVQGWSSTFCRYWYHWYTLDVFRFQFSCTMTNCVINTIQTSVFRVPTNWWTSEFPSRRVSLRVTTASP